MMCDWHAGQDKRVNYASGIQAPLTHVVATPCYRAPEVCFTQAVVTQVVATLLQIFPSYLFTFPHVCCRGPEVHLARAFLADSIHHVV